MANGSKAILWYNMYMVEVQQQPEQPKQEGVLAWVYGGIAKFGSRVRDLFKEDPRIREFLTPEFVKTFHDEYERMLKERREGAAGTTFGNMLMVNGMVSGYSIFDVLIKEYKVDQLPDEIQVKVRMELLEACGLIPGLS